MGIEIGEVISDRVELIDKLKGMPSSREVSIAITKAEEVLHRLVDREQVEKG